MTTRSSIATTQTTSFDFYPDDPREYKFDSSNYGTPGIDSRFVQELFDSDQLRQARIDLGSWAGQEDVRIRFEFSTAGEARPDQSQVMARPANMIEQGHTVTLEGLMPDRTSTVAGGQLTFLSKTFEFTFNGSASGSNIPVNLVPNMPAAQVAERLQQAIANEIRYSDAVPDGFGDYSTQTFPISATHASITVFDLAVTQSPTGLGLPIISGELTGAGSNLPSNDFGVYQNNIGSLDDLVRAGERSKGLGGPTGVYVDDIIIGLAERGESVGGSNQTVLDEDDGDPATTGLYPLIRNPYFEAEFDGAFNAETRNGPYQLELRTAREYGGVQNSVDFFRIIGAAVDPNERLATGLNLEVTSDAIAISDGDQFDLSNGVNTITFEFNKVGNVAPGNVAVSISNGQSAAEVAQAIRDTINASLANSVLEIVATTMSGVFRDSTRLFGNPNVPIDVDPVIALHGYAASSNSGATNFGSHIAERIVGTDEFPGEDNGDRNRHRDQGQVIIEANTISLASAFAIHVHSGNTGNANHQDAIQNFNVLNTRDFVPGVIIENNLVISDQSNDAVGIRLDANKGANGNELSPFARLVNNTVAGWSNGIEILNGASPTLLNNVVIDSTQTGIRYNNTSQTIVRGTVYGGNNTNTTGGPVGTEATFDNPVDLFVNPGVGSVNLASGLPNFYPAERSIVIDASIENQNDRTDIVVVKGSVGIPPSPINAPDYDLVGQFRDDDTTVNNTSGQGQQIIKDRGAIDRSDTRGPQAQLLVPLDNDAERIDIDPDVTFLHLSSGVYNAFEILITEGAGIGPDQSTITPSQVMITENGKLLEEGSDYILGYNSSSRTLRLTPVSGLWRPDAVYEIFLANDPLPQDNGTILPPISDLAGNHLSPNRATGETRFTILMPEVELDFGDAPDSYLTKYDNAAIGGDNGARHAIVNAATPRIGEFVDGEVDSLGVNSDDMASTITIVGNVETPGDSGPFTINGTSISVTSAATSGDNISVTVDGIETVFELLSDVDKANGQTVTLGRVEVPFLSDDTRVRIAFVLINAMRDHFAAEGLAVTADSGTTFSQLDVVLRNLDDEDGVPVGSFVGSTTTPGLFLDVAASGVDAQNQPSTTDPANVIGFLNIADESGTVIDIPVIGDGILDAWFDFDRDGTFEPHEKAIDGAVVTDGNNRFRVYSHDSSLAATAGLTWARFRISTEGIDTPNLLATDGEVEDHLVQIFDIAAPTLVDDERTFDEDQIPSDRRLRCLPALDERCSSARRIYPDRVFAGPSFGSRRDQSFQINRWHRHGAGSCNRIDRIPTGP